MFFRFSTAWCAAFMCLCLFGVKPAAAETAGCNNFIPASIRIDPIFDDTEYVTLPMIKIRALADAEKDVPTEQWPVGLSTAQAILKVQTDIYKVRSGYNQHTCGQIKTIYIQIGFKDNKIYLAKEFPKRSCPYKTVLEHEERHKEVDREILVEFAEKARMVFSDTAKKIGVIKSTAAGLIDEQINEQITIEMDRLAKDMAQERHSRQKLVDSAEEYRRVSESCDGRTMETVQQRLELLEATYPGITKSVFNPGEKTKN